MTARRSWGADHFQLGCWLGVAILIAAVEVVLFFVAQSQTGGAGVGERMLKLNVIIILSLAGLGALRWLFNQAIELASPCPRCGGPMKIVEDVDSGTFQKTTLRCPRCSP